MEEQDGSKKFNISERLEDLRRVHEALRWEGTFRDYFELVTQNPRIAQLSHARLNDMIQAAGLERLNEGTRDEVISYKFFSPELFGIEEPIARLVEYFKSAAQRDHNGQFCGGRAAGCEGGRTARTGLLHHATRTDAARRR